MKTEPTPPLRRNEMRTSLNLTAAIVLFLFSTGSPLAVAQTDSRAASIESKFVTVEGIKIHYLTAGRGPAVILMHGYMQTSRMWRPLIPRLIDKFTVIAPDLPGIGESDIPKDGLDMKTAAVRIHALANSLGITKSRV